MAEEVQIISTLDNAQTLGALGQTEKAVNSNTEALEGATQASTELLKGIVKESKAAQKTLSELTASSEKLTEEIENTQRGTKRYAELKNELIGVNKEIKNVELSFEALDSEQVASEVGSVVGGMTDVATGAFLALGVAEDSAQEFFNTLAQVEGTGRIVKGSIEGIQSASKLYNNVIKQGNILQQANAATLGAVGVAQKAYTAAIGTSTGGLKLFKLALIGTGIGAIVVGLGLLIANFDAIKNAVSKAIDGFNDLGVVMKIILYPITLIVEAYNLMQKALIELGVIQSEEAKKAIAAAEERVASLAKEKDAIGEKFDFEISKARAAGKDTVELEKEKRKAVLENLKAQANAILALVKLSGEFNDEQREALQDISKQAKELSKESVVEEIKNTKKKADEAKKAAEEAKKLAEKRRAEELAAQKAQAEELNKIAQELVELKIASIEDETTRELALLDNKFDARINKLKTGGEEEIELAKALEIEKARQVAEVNDKAEADRIAKKKEAADLERENASLLAQTEIEIKQAKAQTEREELEAQKEADILAENEAFEQKLVNLQERGLLTQELEAEIETARQASLASIDAQFKIDKDAQDEEFKNREIARENKKRNDKIAIAATTAGALSSIAGSLDTLGVKSAGLSKTLAIAEIAISTAKGVAGAVAAGSSIPFPGNIPAIITGVASVVSGIASAKKALSSAKVPGGGGGGSVSIPSVNIPGGSGASIAPSTPNLNLTPGSGGDSGGDTNEAGSNQVIKAFVVESEISDEQSNAKVIEEKSELN